MTSLKETLEKCRRADSRDKRLSCLTWSVAAYRRDWNPETHYVITERDELALAYHVSEAIYDEYMFNAMQAYEETIRRKALEAVEKQRTGEINIMEARQFIAEYRQQAAAQFIASVSAYFERAPS